MGAIINETTAATNGNVTELVGSAENSIPNPVPNTISLLRPTAASRKVSVTQGSAQHILLLPRPTHILGTIIADI